MFYSDIPIMCIFMFVISEKWSAGHFYKMAGRSFLRNDRLVISTKWSVVLLSPGHFIPGHFYKMTGIKFLMGTKFVMLIWIPLCSSGIFITCFGCIYAMTWYNSSWQFVLLVTHPDTEAVYLAISRRTLFLNNFMECPLPPSFIFN